MDQVVCSRRGYCTAVLLCVLGHVGWSCAQAPSGAQNSSGVHGSGGVIAPRGVAGAGSPVAIKAVAEVVQRRTESGGESSALVPADRVASGDSLIYTLEVRNTAARAIAPPTVIYAVPEHTTYLAESAVGPATLVSYSVDGGLSFDTPENLKVEQPGRPPRLATAADYTHIRWQLKHGLKGNSTAFVRFRARMK